MDLDEEDDWTQDLDLGLLEAETATVNSLRSKRDALEPNGGPATKVARYEARSHDSEYGREIARLKDLLMEKEGEIKNLRTADQQASYPSLGSSRARDHMRTVTELESKRQELKNEYEAKIAALERQLKHDQTEKAFMQADINRLSSPMKLPGQPTPSSSTQTPTTPTTKSAIADAFPSVSSFHSHLHAHTKTSRSHKAIVRPANSRERMVAVDEESVSQPQPQQNQLIRERVQQVTSAMDIDADQAVAASSRDSPRLRRNPNKSSINTNIREQLRLKLTCKTVKMYPYGANSLPEERDCIDVLLQWNPQDETDQYEVFNQLKQVLLTCLKNVPDQAIDISLEQLMNMLDRWWEACLEAKLYAMLKPVLRLLTTLLSTYDFCRLWCLDGIMESDMTYSRFARFKTYFTHYLEIIYMDRKSRKENTFLPYYVPPEPPGDQEQVWDVLECIHALAEVVPESRREEFLFVTTFHKYLLDESDATLVKTLRYYIRVLQVLCRSPKVDMFGNAALDTPADIRKGCLIVRPSSTGHYTIRTGCVYNRILKLMSRHMESEERFELYSEILRWTWPFCSDPDVYQALAIRVMLDFVLPTAVIESNGLIDNEHAHPQLIVFLRGVIDRLRVLAQWEVAQDCLFQTTTGFHARWMTVFLVRLIFAKECNFAILGDHKDWAEIMLRQLLTTSQVDEIIEDFTDREARDSQAV